MVPIHYFILCDDDFILRGYTSFADALAIMRDYPTIGGHWRMSA